MTRRLISALLTVLISAGCQSKAAEDPWIAALSPAMREARARCIAIIVDSVVVSKDSFDLTGQSTEGGVVEVSRLQGGAERIAVTYFGETGRWSESFVFAKDTLICADERYARYDRPLSGIVVDSTPNAVLYADGVASWLWALTAADSLAGKPDSLDQVGLRLWQAADTIREWVATERKARGTGAS